MAELGDQRKRGASFELISHCFVSFMSFSLTHLALYVVPLFFPTSSHLALLLLSVVVLFALAGVGRCSKRFLGVRASAPSFVFFNIIFIWGVYIGVIRQVTSSLMDFIINSQFLLLVTGLFSILSKDPGYVPRESDGVPHEFAAEENSIQLQRVRYCKHCKAYVKGFDHHCPAFGNCIGQKNHVLFLILLVGFVLTEISYISCSSQFTAEVHFLASTAALSSMLTNLAISTMLFCFLQVLWQVVFLAWHIYCVCFNIKTDEWINWKKYPEFHSVILPERGLTPNECEVRFTNPYNKGILWNVKDFLTMK